jgi:hypothetical protein
LKTRTLGIFRRRNRANHPNGDEGCDKRNQINRVGD